MIDQRTNGQVFPALRNSAKASVRLLSSYFLLLTPSYFEDAPQLISRVNSNAARSSYVHQHGDVCSAPCRSYNPHRQLSLLHPTL